MCKKIFPCVLILVVVGVGISADAVLKADVQVVPEAAVQNHVPHHADSVFNLKVKHRETLGCSCQSCKA